MSVNFRQTTLLQLMRTGVELPEVFFWSFMTFLVFDFGEDAAHLL